jgi:hypothetical protein
MSAVSFHGADRITADDNKKPGRVEKLVKNVRPEKPTRVISSA